MIKNLLICFALSTSLISCLHAATKSDLHQEEMEIQRGATCAVLLAQELSTHWYDSCLETFNAHLGRQHRIDRVLASLGTFEMPLHSEVFHHILSSQESSTEHDRESKQHLALVLLVYRNLVKNDTITLNEELPTQIENFLMKEKAIDSLTKTVNNSLNFKPAVTSLCALFQVEKNTLRERIIAEFRAHRDHIVSEHEEADDEEDCLLSVSNSETLTDTESSTAAAGSTRLSTFRRSAWGRQYVQKSKPTPTPVATPRKKIVLCITPSKQPDQQPNHSATSLPSARGPKPLVPPKPARLVIPPQPKAAAQTQTTSSQPSVRDLKAIFERPAYDESDA